MKNRKYDIYVLAILLIIAAAGFLLRPQSKSNMIKITLNKEVYGYYDLNKNQTIHINKENTLKLLFCKWVVSSNSLREML